MKMWEIFRFEFVYQASRIWTWLIIIVLIVLAFLMTRDNSLSEALYEDFFINSPFSIAKTTVFGTLVWLMIAAVISGESAARDVATGMHPMVYTMPLDKASYLGGRFLSAFILNSLILFSIQIGILLAIYLPGIDAAMIGPFRSIAYLTAYAYISLPTAFAAMSIQFLLSVRSGRPMSGYLGSFLIFFMSYFVASILLYDQDYGKLLDPIGVKFILEDLSHLWTSTEKSWRLLEFKGLILKNRLIWIGVAIVVLAYTYMHFHFVHRTSTNSWKNLKKTITKKLYKFSQSNSNDSVIKINSIYHLETRQKYGIIVQVRQFLAITWSSFRAIASSWAGIALLFIIPLITIPVLIDQIMPLGIPTTLHVISEITTPLTAELSRWVIIPPFLIFFAGELIWRERSAGISEITDTMPYSDWTALLGKFVGLILIIILFLVLLMASGLIFQISMGYQPSLNEILLYGKVLFGLQLIEYSLFALLAFVIHVLVNQVYIGNLVGILIYIILTLSTMFGLEHNLLIYGASPPWTYSEMRGFGLSLGPWMWFKLYWTAWSMLLILVAKLLWTRGKENGLDSRLKRARLRLSRSTLITAIVAIGLIITFGSYIFYNTNVLNSYFNSNDIYKRKADYELLYKQYEKLSQPNVTEVNFHVEIYPKKREAVIKGIYKLVNKESVAVDSIHVTTTPGYNTEIIDFSRSTFPTHIDDELGYHIYTLEEPLQVGDSLFLRFEVEYRPQGFQNRGIHSNVLKNGTYIARKDGIPYIGYQESRELITATDRRDHNLTPERLIPSLYDDKAIGLNGGGIKFKAVIGTDDDQVAIAPGNLLKTWKKNGRQYYEYETSAPIGNEYAFFSADYAVHEEIWNEATDIGKPVTIRIYYHLEHNANVERMLSSIKASFDYYTEEFGPYAYDHLTIVEKPGQNGIGMHADASMITHGEGFASWIPRDGKFDHPYAVIAHEMAHQWTVPYAFVEGAPVMSESIAWYYGMKAVEHSRGPEEFRKLLYFMRNSRAPIRRGEPLLRGLDPYMSYRKGPLALYTISEYIGEQKVNKALRTLLEKHQSTGASLATTLDLYEELNSVTPDSLKYLLHDLFKVNTYWKLEAKNGSAKQTEDGSWEVTINVHAEKMVMDSAGVETEIPINDYVEVAVFAPVGIATFPNQSLYRRKHHLVSAEESIIVTVPGKPEKVGIDPRQLLIDTKKENNIIEVDIRE